MELAPDGDALPHSGVVSRIGDHVAKIMGVGGLKAVSKVFTLLLAAIAVGMIIRGLQLSNILK